MGAILGTVTASGMRMHHVLILLTLTFIQGHTYLNNENNKMFDYFRNCSSNPHDMKFAAKTDRLKVYIIFTRSNDLTLVPKSTECYRDVNLIL